MDGEVVADQFHAFDLISLDGTDLHHPVCSDRYRALTLATVSARVTTINGQRSVGVSLLDGDDWQPVGNVTVPANQEVPSGGDVVEVRYLYASPVDAKS